MSPPLPIAYVAGQFPLRSETFVWREVRELRRRGWIVHTFGLRQPDEIPGQLADLAAATRSIYDLPGGSLPRGHGWVWDALLPGESTSVRNRLVLRFQHDAGRRLARELHRLGVGHVHAHFAHAPTSVAMYAAAAAGVSFSFTGHANDLFRRRQLLRRKLSRAAFVACISRWHRDLYASIEPAGRYEIVRCGVNLDAYAHASERRPGHLRVLTVCRLVEKKGVDTLLRAARGLEGVTVTVAGDGPEAAALRRDSDAGVEFLGAVDPDDVPGLLARHDVFALPCRAATDGDRDGIPVALMEAMASRLPVVAGDLPALRELIIDNETGRLIDTHGSDRGTSALREVLSAWRDDPSAAARVAVGGRLLVEQEFSLDASVSRLEALFRASQV